MYVRKFAVQCLLALVVCAPMAGCYRHTTVKSTELTAVVAQCNMYPRKIENVAIDRETEIRVDGEWKNLCAGEWDRPADLEVQLRRKRQQNRGARPAETFAGIALVTVAVALIAGVVFVIWASQIDFSGMSFSG